MCIRDRYYTHRPYSQLTFSMFFLINRVFAIKIVQPIFLSNLTKARFIPASLWLCLRWANRRNSVRSQKYKSRLGKRKDRLALRSTASYFLGTRRRGTPMWQKQLFSSSTAAAQQKHSRSSSGNSGDGGGVEGGVGGGSTASLFLQSCRSSTVVHKYYNIHDIGRNLKYL